MYCYVKQFYLIFRVFFFLFCLAVFQFSKLCREMDRMNISVLSNGSSNCFSYLLSVLSCMCVSIIFYEVHHISRLLSFIYSIIIRIFETTFIYITVALKVDNTCEKTQREREKKTFEIFNFEPKLAKLSALTTKNLINLMCSYFVSSIYFDILSKFIFISLYECFILVNYIHLYFDHFIFKIISIDS